jgi:hypothetical protein
MLLDAGYVHERDWRDSSFGTKKPLLPVSN